MAWGLSQRSALSIIATTLDTRIKCLGALCPAMCDHTGYLYGRAGGWPHFLDDKNKEKYNSDDVLNTLPYYDTVNLAKKLRGSTLGDSTIAQHLLPLFMRHTTC